MAKSKQKAGAAVKPKPAAAKSKPKASKPAAPAKKPAPAPQPAPVPKTADEPKNLFALIADCGKLYHDADDAKKLCACSQFPAVSAVVTGFAAGLSIPTAKAYEPLREFRAFFLPPVKLVLQDDRGISDGKSSSNAVVVQPPVMVDAGTPENPKPWEPVPPSIARMLAGQATEAEQGTWQTNGVMWEYRAGWPEPRRTGETVVSEHASSAAMVESSLANGVGPEGTPEEAGGIEFAEPDPTPETYPVDVKPVDEGGRDRDVVDDSGKSVTEQLAETGPAALGSEPVTLPLKPTTEPGPGEDDGADLDEEEPFDQSADYEPTRAELEAEEAQLAREEAEAAREHEIEMAAGKRRK